MSRRRTEVGGIVRHTVAHSTGATIVVERTGPGSPTEQDSGWACIDLSHSTLIMHDTRELADRFAAAPEEWCDDCRDIYEGKRPRITSGKVQ